MPGSLPEGRTRSGNRPVRLCSPVLLGIRLVKSNRTEVQCEQINDYVKGSLPAFVQMDGCSRVLLFVVVGLLR